MLCALSYEPPTDYDGVGKARNGTVVGYWYLNEDRTEFDGHFISNDGMSTGKWRYDDGTELSGTWQNDDGEKEGTWMATEDDPFTFYDSSPAELNEDCGFVQSLNRAFECAEGLECAEVSLGEPGLYTEICINQTPTDYDGVGMDKSGNIAGYWFLNEDRTEFDGTFVSRVGSGTGKWRYDAGTTLTGTWYDDDGTQGTWIAYEDEPFTFIDSTPEPKAVGELCNAQDECEEGLLCRD